MKKAVCAAVFAAASGVLSAQSIGVLADLQPVFTYFDSSLPPEITEQMKKADFFFERAERFCGHTVS